MSTAKIELEIPYELAIILKKDPLLKKYLRDKLISELYKKLTQLYIADELFKDSKLTEEDIMELDKKIKKKVMEKLKWMLS
ncbi:MAG: hypothetical protein ACP6IU_10255 [Candidatus Asgardarchaeia archaeon]